MHDTFARAKHSAGRPSATRENRVSYIPLLIYLFDNVIFAQILDRNKEQFCDLIAINKIFCFNFICLMSIF